MLSQRYLSSIPRLHKASSTSAQISPILAHPPQINSLGGLSLILISHPHFYTTWVDWSRTFRCPVYLSKIDADAWLNRPTPSDADLRLLSETYTTLLPGVTAIISGGHFDGSMVCHWEDGRDGVLCLADTIFTVAVGDPFPGTRQNPASDEFSPFWRRHHRIQTQLPVSGIQTRMLIRSCSRFRIGFP